MTMLARRSRQLVRQPARSANVASRDNLPRRDACVQSHAVIIRLLTTMDPDIRPPYPPPHSPPHKENRNLTKR